MIRLILQTLSITGGAKMKQFKSYLLKEDIKDILLSDYKNKEMLLDEILDEYLFLINDIRKDELEDIIVNQFDSI